MNLLKLSLIIANSRKNTELVSSIYAKYLQVTRAALAPNPLQLFNPTVSNLPTTFANNVIATHGDWGFIGGDTINVEIDMSTKVANSVVECPVKIYWTISNSGVPLAPSDASWSEESSQSNLDALKSQDNVTLSSSRTNNGQLAQRMLEIDLTSLANALYGGSNSALKSALKSIQADVWAMGSGSNGGIQTYGVQTVPFYNNTNSWSSGSDLQTSSASAITKISKTYIAHLPDTYVNSSNKVYLLVASQYASDGTIASSVSLDYFKLTIGLNRTVDTVAPQTVNLPKKWIMVGSFSPCFDNTKLDSIRRIFTLYSDVNNRFSLFWETPGQFKLVRHKNGVATTLVTSNQVFNKNQVYRYAVGQNASGMFIYLLKNSSTVEKVTNTDIDFLVGSMSLYSMMYTTTQQADMFADQFQLYDLDALGKSTGLTDAEADAILRGTQPNLIGASMKELFDINQVSLHANAVRSGNTITLNATALFQESYIDVPVLPNNQYELSYAFSSSGGDGYTYIREYCGNVMLTSTSNTNRIRTFTTGNKTNKVRIIFGNTGQSTGIFSFTINYFKLKQ